MAQIRVSFYTRGHWVLYLGWGWDRCSHGWSKRVGTDCVCPGRGAVFPNGRPSSPSPGQQRVCLYHELTAHWLWSLQPPQTVSSLIRFKCRFRQQMPSDQSTSWKRLTVCMFHFAKISHTFQLLFSTAALPCREFTFNMSQVLYILTYFISQKHAQVKKKYIFHKCKEAYFRIFKI